MLIVTVEKLIISMMPYFIFIIPALPIVNRSNFMYLFVVMLYIVMKFRPKEFSGIWFLILSMLVLVVYGFASLLWTGNVQQGISILLALITGFIVMSTIVFFTNSNNIDVFIKHMHICTLIILIIGTYEIYTGNCLFIKNIDFVGRLNMYDNYYPTVFFSNPNDVAYYLLIGTPISIVHLTMNKGKKISSLILSIFSLVVILNTESRLTLMAIVALTCISIILICKKKITVRKYLIFNLCGIIVCILVLTKFGVENTSNTFINNELLKIDTSESYFTIRDNLLQQSFNLGIKTFPFGAGLGSITSLLNIPPHNLFALLWSDLGIFIFILFICFYLYGIYKLYKTYNFNFTNSNKYRVMSSILLVLWTMMPIITSISSVAEQRKITWVLIGLSISQIKMCMINNRINQI